MKLRRRFAAAMGLIVLMISGSILGVSQASAASTGDQRAMAAPWSSPRLQSDVPVSANGNMEFWTDYSFTGTSCIYSGGYSDLGACHNISASVKNRRYAGTYSGMNLYWGSSQTEAYGCIGQGTGWTGLADKYFNFGGSILFGYGKSMYRNIASMGVSRNGCRG